MARTTTIIKTTITIQFSINNNNIGNDNSSLKYSCHEYILKAASIGCDLMDWNERGASKRIQKKAKKNEIYLYIILSGEYYCTRCCGDFFAFCFFSWLPPLVHHYFFFHTIIIVILSHKIYGEEHKLKNRFRISKIHEERESVSLIWLKKNSFFDWLQ